MASANAKLTRQVALLDLPFRLLSPEQAYDQLAIALNEMEASGKIRIHWRHHQVCLLPENGEIERPIALTCITYRLWCSGRYKAAQK